MTSTPQSLSLRQLRADGFTCASVEHWDACIKRKRDLFPNPIKDENGEGQGGGFDIIAFSSGVPALLVQTTSRDNMLSRIRKILANPIAKQWMSCCHRRIQVHGWHQPGGKNTKYECDVAHFHEYGATRIVRNKVRTEEWTV